MKYKMSRQINSWLITGRIERKASEINKKKLLSYSIKCYEWFKHIRFHGNAFRKIRMKILQNHPAWIKISCHLSQAGNSDYLFIQFTPHEMIKTFVGYYVAICFNPHELLLRVKWSKFFFITALEVESILALFSLFNLSNKKEKKFFAYLQKLWEWWDFGVFHACLRTCLNITSISGNFLPTS